MGRVGAGAAEGGDHEAGRSGQSVGGGRREPVGGQPAADLRDPRVAAQAEDSADGRGDELAGQRDGRDAAGGDSARVQPVHVSDHRASTEHGDGRGPDLRDGEGRGEGVRQSAESVGEGGSVPRDGGGDE